jgi:NitT/TauT family transport system permease protein
MHDAFTPVVMSATGPNGAPTSPITAKPKGCNVGRVIPLLGPLALFCIWDLVVRFKLIPPILLPSPWVTLATLGNGMWGGELLKDFSYTLLRTLEAFVLASLVGVPIGILLGSNELPRNSKQLRRKLFQI